MFQEEGKENTKYLSFSLCIRKCITGSGSIIVYYCVEDSHVEAGHYDSVMYLRLWKGDLIGALHMATEKGELTDHLLSLAPMGKTPFTQSAVLIVCGVTFSIDMGNFFSQLTFLHTCCLYQCLTSMQGK